MAESESESSPTSSEIYVNDLADMQTYLEGLQQLVAECGAEAGDGDDDFVLRQFAADEYLAALRVKQQQLDDLREYVRRNPADPTSSLLNQMLDVVEPLCGDVVQTLAR